MRLTDVQKAEIRQRPFPIQAQRGAAPHPLSVPWSVAEKAYSGYAARYGTEQSLERLAQRGGFGPSEMDTFLPGWREEVSEIAALRRAVDGLRKENDDLRARLYVDGDNRAAAERCAAALRGLVEQLPFGSLLAASLAVRAAAKAADGLTSRHAPPAQCACLHFDDGSAFHLASFAGGAAPGGRFSTLTCIERQPDGTEVIRHYVETEP